jgi:16S rRNA (adenine1518-N6/adenine1519-N6)-dimethyltransferase
MARVRLGQCFLWDRRILRRIADQAKLSCQDLVIEIGAGDGRLTRYLRNRAAKVIAVEIDPALARGLQQAFADDPDVQIVQADFLKLDLAALIDAAIDPGREEGSASPPPEGGWREQDGGKAAFVGNIPYYITTPIIEKLIESISRVQSVTILMQQEVAERISAKPGEPACGSISAYVTYHFWAQRLFDVPAYAFRPRPKVTSSVVRMVPRAVPPVAVEDPDLMFMIVRSAFEQSRKKALNALADAEWLGMEKAALSRILTMVGIDPGARAQHIALDQYAALADAVRRAWREDPPPAINRRDE